MVRRLTRSVAYAVALVLVLTTACMPSATPTPVPTATPRPAVALPADDAAHETPIEWWYYSGHLTGLDGTTYGLHYVFFQVRDPRTGNYALVPQLAITDHQTGKYVTAQSLAPRFTAPRLWGFWAAAGLWSISGFSGEHELVASTPDYAFNLQLRALKPPVLHDRVGYVDFPRVGRSFYYSRTRMLVQGTLVDHGTPKPVFGQVWFDHQWGDFQPTALGWDWFSLNLDDDTDLMLYDVRYLDGNDKLAFGTLVDGAGTPTYLHGEELKLTPRETWTSPITGTKYPVSWAVSVPSLGLDVTVEPVLRESEFDARRSTGNVYWEGEVRVTGTRGGKAIGGTGFLELTGYGSQTAPRP